MPKTIFHAVPAMRCHCPAKHFRNAQAALQYARKASAAFRAYSRAACASRKCFAGQWQRIAGTA